MNYKLSIGICLIGLAVFDINAAIPETLRHNPFEQPEFLQNRSGGKSGNSTSDSMKLHGTVLDGADSVANIDGKYYRIHNEVAGYLVISIENGSVTLRRGDIDMVLTLENDK
jgi:hypothetical protein